ncbi:four helix bundle protein [Ochrovirga pacifica]|uniref:four helix bundle protein n=1 Tax=Ochrovirga pacifica TaxID=1042376 RepID=UPI0002558722|nr:four helix bundle protein [Ochrovirga pacifica]
MKKELKSRTKKFAIDCWKLCKEVPKTREFNAFVNQLIRSSSSVGANYRAAQRAKSTADFINKLKIVEEEVDESIYWLEILEEVSDVNESELKRLIKEGKELLAITVASINTAKRNRNS